jgi:protein gp37
VADNSGIQWTDSTWNPVTGCTRASSGCDFCYAVTMTKRLEAMGQEKYSGLVNLGKNHFNGVVKTHEDALLIPLGWKKPRRVFVNSMSDLFHREVPFEFIDKVFAIMALTPQHTYQVLTKRPERMAEYFSTEVSEFRRRLGDIAAIEFGVETDTLEKQWQWPLPNVWLGTSCEDQQTADERIPHLLNIPAKVRFLSCEPLLGPIDLTNLNTLPYFEQLLKSISEGLRPRGIDPHAGGPVAQRTNCLNGQTVQEYADEFATKGAMGVSWPTSVIESDAVHWVIVGGESGSKARPMDPAWARSLRDQCQAVGVPFFFKQWGAWLSYQTPSNCPPNLCELRGRDHTQMPSGLWMSYVGKHQSGRRLDGREWNEFPEVASA